MLTITMNSSRKLTRIIRAIRLLRHANLSTRRIIIRFNSNKQAITMRSMQLTNIQINRSKQISNLSGNSTFRHTDSRQLVNNLRQANQVINRNRTSNKLAIQRLHTMMRMMLTILLLSNQYPHKTRKPQKSNNILVTVNNQLIILISVRSRTLINPIRRINKTRHVRMVTTPTKRTINNQMGPRLTIRMISIQINMLTKRRQIITRNSLLRHPNFHVAIARVSGRDAILDRINHAAVNRHLAVGNRLSKIITAISNRLSKRLNHITATIRRNNSNLHKPIRNKARLEIIIDTARQIQIEQRDTREGALRDGQTNLLSLLDDRHTIPRIRVIRQALRM